MKVLIHHDGALGDTILSVPCLQAIRKRHDSVHLAARRDIADFLQSARIVDVALSSGDACFSSLYTRPDRQLTDFLSAFDSALVFTVTADSPAAVSIAARVPDTQVVLTVPPAGSNIHVGAYRLSQIASAADVSRDSVILVRSGQQPAVSSILGQTRFPSGVKLVGLHPGSGGRAKRWPLERYFELVERLQRTTNMTVMIFTGEAEDEEMKRTIECFAGSRKNTIHADNHSLCAAASLLAVCDCYIGNDSGFTHLAALAGCPTIALFGPTDPTVWKPVGRRVEIISSENNDIERITVDLVFERTAGILSSKAPRHEMTIPRFGY